jgi:hypothetical protein
MATCSTALSSGRCRHNTSTLINHRNTSASFWKSRIALGAMLKDNWIKFRSYRRFVSCRERTCRSAWDQACWPLRRFDAAGAAWQPYLRANLWHYFGGTDNAMFAGTTVIPTSVSATTAQLQLGIVAKVSARGSLFANVGYTTNVNGEHRSIVAGDVGVRWKW